MKFSETKEGKKLINNVPCSADEDCNCSEEIENLAYEAGQKSVRESQITKANEKMFGKNIQAQEFQKAFNGIRLKERQRLKQLVMKKLKQYKPQILTDSAIEEDMESLFEEQKPKERE